MLEGQVSDAVPRPTQRRKLNRRTGSSLVPISCGSSALLGELAAVTGAFDREVEVRMMNWGCGRATATMAVCWGRIDAGTMRERELFERRERRCREGVMVEGIRKD
jgi:hypothetical protein